MLRRFLLTLFITLFLLLVPVYAYAAYDPSSVTNNKYGIHILFPTEISEAAKLVNSSGGDWGYVTIPLSENDFDLDKWQTFMDEAKKLHIIPIIRIATWIDPLNTSVWKIPSYYDIIDSANFLNSLDWPTKNRYVVIYNEVNRGDEWGGLPNPYEYADLLSFAADTFHSRSADFFIISAGLDNAAPNAPTSYINEYTFVSLMETAVPGVFDKIDGIASHAYPNPGFATTPQDYTAMSIYSFLFEKDLIQSFSNKNHPIFITETGWDKEKTDIETISSFYKFSFENVWTDPRISAVTPFILNAGTGAFPKFSFISQNGEKTSIYNSYQSLKKPKGNPKLAQIHRSKTISKKVPPIKRFRTDNDETFENQKGATRQVLKFILGLP